MLDKLDVFIIKNIYESNPKEVNTWDLSRGYLKKCCKSVNTSSVFAQNNIIRSRLQRLAHLGVIFITKKKEDEGRTYVRNEYNLVGDYVRIGKHKYPDGYHKTLLVNIDSLWYGFQID